MFFESKVFQLFGIYNYIFPYTFHCIELFCFWVLNEKDLAKRALPYNLLDVEIIQSYLRIIILWIQSCRLVPTLWEYVWFFINFHFGDIVSSIRILSLIHLHIVVFEFSIRIEYKIRIFGILVLLFDSRHFQGYPRNPLLRIFFASCKFWEGLGFLFCLWFTHLPRHTMTVSYCGLANRPSW